MSSDANLATSLSLFFLDLCPSWLVCTVWEVIDDWVHAVVMDSLRRSCHCSLEEGSDAPLPQEVFIEFLFSL